MNHWDRLLDKVKRDLLVEGSHVTVEPWTQYGGMGSVSLRCKGVYFYSIPDEMRGELESEGYIDFMGQPTGKGVEQ